MSPRAQRPRPKPRAVSLHKPNPTHIISSHLSPVFSNSPSRDLAHPPLHPLSSPCAAAEFLAAAAAAAAAVAMARVYVGNLDPRVTARELEDEFRVFGVLRSVWVARKPPGFAFIDFDDRRDAQDAIRDIDGKNGWRVELSRNASSGRGGRDRYGSSESKCYECGETGHFARECRLRIGSGGLGSGRRRSRSRSRSRSPRYRRSPSYGRRSYSPAGRSPRRRSVSPARARSYSRSPQYNRGRDESPAYDNGYEQCPTPNIIINSGL
uniref:Uncharacterized protein n=1 Tax=Oryza nivara TaxID=4536 RepID=A0A0E0HQ22_ORYNI